MRSIIFLLCSLLCFSSCQKEEPQSDFIWLKKLNPLVVNEPDQADGKHAHLIFFISRHCPVSHKYLKEIKRVGETYNSGRLVPYLIYVDHPREEAHIAKHAENHPISINTIIDKKHRLVDHFKVDITPSAVILGAKGEILYKGRIDNWFIELDRHRYQATMHDLTNMLDVMAAGRKPKAKETQAIGCQIRKF